MRLLLILLPFFLTLPAASWSQEPPSPPHPRRASAPPEHSRHVSPEMEQDALDFIRLIAPYRLEDLKALKSANPEDFHRRVMEIHDIKRQLDFARQHDPEMADLKLNEVKLEHKSHYLSEQYRRARSEDEKSRIEQELRTLLEQLFDIKEKGREAEVRRLELELGRLKSTLSERKKNKDQIVTLRLEELTGERSALKW